jgi:carbon-monoxide dehydrogenase medium subunit
VAHADPAADLPTVILALDGKVEIAGTGGTRMVTASEFFLGMMTTAVGENEIVTAIWVASLAGRGASYQKFAHPASRYAVVGAAAVLEAAGGTCKSARIAIGGATVAPTRLTAVEQALAGAALSPESINAAAAETAGALPADLVGDIFASADYRRAVAGTYVARAIAAAASVR